MPEFRSVPQRIEDSLQSDQPWLFLSPHLDDAVLSCGALIEQQAGNREITVATIFTECAPPPYTRSARAFLRLSGVQDTDRFYTARRAEDHAIFQDLQVQSIHFGETDAIFRPRRIPAVGRPVAKLLPELSHRYPTYRFHIVGGKVARGDRALVSALRARVSELVEETRAELLFCPVGIGRHADHLAAREVGAAFPERVVYYSDFPYNQSAGPDPTFLEKNLLRPWTWDEGIGAKQRWIRQYATQVDALFPGGVIPTAAETYYAPA